MNNLKLIITDEAFNISKFVNKAGLTQEALAQKGKY